MLITICEQIRNMPALNEKTECLYINLAHHLREQFQIYANLFFSVCHKPMGGDNLLPLLILLLPSDVALSTHIIKKLEPIIDLRLSGEITYPFVTLISSAMYKLEQMQTKQIAEEDALIMKIADAIREAESANQIQQILIDELKQCLIKYDKLLYDYYIISFHSPEEILDQIKDEFQFETIIIPENMQLQLLFDMCYTFVIQKKNPQKRFETFWAKYDNYIEYIKQVDLRENYFCKPFSLINNLKKFMLFPSKQENKIKQVNENISEMVFIRS